MSQEVRLERQGFRCSRVGSGGGYLGMSEADGSAVEVYNVPREVSGCGSASGSC